MAIVRNAVEALDESAPNLRHVHIVQGSKYYGSHVGPFETPAKEDQPRGLVANFYYLQQDYLVEKQHGARWTWSASRPDALIHGTAGVGRNLVAVIAAYALICRELSVPFYFPGGAVAYDALYQCTSIDQLTAAIAWMSEAPNAANQAFNVVNGDYFRWSALWPVFAEHFGLRLGPARIPAQGGHGGQGAALGCNRSTPQTELAAFRTSGELGLRRLHPFARVGRHVGHDESSSAWISSDRRDDGGVPPLLRRIAVGARHPLSPDSAALMIGMET